jgi:hypothetical protein
VRYDDMQAGFGLLQFPDRKQLIGDSLAIFM